MIASIQDTAHRVRKRVLRHVLGNDGGYLSQACSSAEALATLYLQLMNLGPSEAPPIPPPFPGVPGPGRPGLRGAATNGPRAPELDRLVFSPVHYALPLYATLIEVGRLHPDALAQFNADGSTVEMIGAEHSPGIEVTAGSLGQALSQAGGIALARRLRGEPGKVWVYLSDGELQEGQTWESFAALAHHQLSNVRVLIDCNAQQCDGPMASVMRVEPAADRLRAFGASVHEVDGHDVSALIAAAQAPSQGGPVVVLCHTDPCRGVTPMRARAPKLHYVRFTSDAERAAFRDALEAM